MLAKIVFNVLLLLPLLPFVMVAQGQSELQLSDYQWENRLLLVFDSSQASAEYKQQLEELNSRKDGMFDRDLKVFHLFSTEESFGDGAKISEQSSEALHEKYEVKPGHFTIILIGKDGSEKLRTNNLLEVEKLFSRIDSMPMRRLEMRNKGY